MSGSRASQKCMRSDMFLILLISAKKLDYFLH